jgi:8-oxo-dGTP pyrophosphatase MutT (NUDIX family)
MPDSNRSNEGDGLPAGVVVVVRRVDGRYLYIQRAAECTFGGYWCPVSGRVEPGETHAQTAVRETLEEVGVHVRALREVHVGLAASGRFILHWWLCEHLAGEPHCAAPEEVAAVAWVSATEASQRAPHFPVDIDLMHRLDLELGSLRSEDRQRR